MRLLDRAVEGRLQMQAQRSEMMSEDIVQLAGNSQALSGFAALTEQLARGCQFRIDASQILASKGLAFRHRSCDQGKDLESQKRCGAAPPPSHVVMRLQ